MPAAADDRASARDPVIVTTLLVALTVVVVMTATRSLEFGSSAGNFAYGYLRPFQWSSLLVFAVVAPAAIWTVVIAAPRLRSEWLSVALIVAVGTVGQFVIRSRATFSLAYASRIERDYFDVARSYGLRQLLRDFDELAPTLPTHARANMPGKVVLFEALLPISESHAVLSVLVALLSIAGGVAVYLMTRSLFDSRSAACAALALYLFLPARIYFLPLVNTVTPTLLALLLWGLVSYLRRGRPWIAVAVGVGTYLTVAFEPTPVLFFGVFAGISVAVGLIRRLSLAEAVSLLGLTVLGFGLAYVTMLAATGFDLFPAFAHVREDAADFNAYWGRGYFDFLVPNVRELLVNTGIVVAVPAVALSGWAAWSVRHSLRDHRPADPIAVVALAATATLVLLAVSGVSRGEVSRLWIVEAVMLAVVLAGICARAPGARLLPFLLGAGIFQAALAIETVGFAVQGRYCPHCQGLPSGGLSAWFDVFLALAVGIVAVRAFRRPLSDPVADVHTSPSGGERL